MAKKVIDSTYFEANLKNLVSNFLDFRYLKVVSELPTSADSDTVFLYIGETIDTEQIKRYKGGLYNYNNGWVEIPDRLSAEVSKKQNKTLETALVVSGSSYTTVEDVLSALNNSKLDIATTEPSESADGDIIMYIGAATVNLPSKGIYVYNVNSSKWNNLIIFGEYAKGTATTLDIGRNSLSTVGEYSSAEGYNTAATGRYSHSEGNSSEATAESAHAEGQETTARGYNAHAEGNRTDASGNYSHAEGQYSMATSNSDHAEGYYTEASGGASHAEGDNTEASGSSAHAEGEHSTASGRSSHAEGYYNIAQEMYAHAEGGATTASGTASHAEGTNNLASGARAHAEGGGTEATASDSHAEGANTDANGVASHAEGGNRNADGSDISSERTVTIGNETVSVLGPKAVGVASHAEGVRTLAYGYASHASGIDTDATGEGSYTEGYETKASGRYSHAEGSITSATGSNAHAEGTVTLASGDFSHAEGGGTTASGATSHTEGSYTKASGSNAHAEGSNTTASGAVSHAQNNHTIAGYANQTAMGTYNNNKSTNLLEVGNGADGNSRSNAMEVTADGDLLIKNGGVSLYGLDENKEVLGAKNLLPLTLDTIKSLNRSGTWSGNVCTYHAMTFTVNTDELGNVTDITVNGTSDSEYSTLFYLNKNLVMDNDIILNGCPSGGSTSTYRLDMGSNATSDVGSGVNVSAGTYSEGCRIVVFAYQEVTNKVFRPMIRLATDPNPTYRPYAKGNIELTSNVNTLNINKELLGAKNLLPLTLENLKALNTAGTWNNNVYTFKGLSFTVNTGNFGGVASITISGQPSGGYTFVLFQGTLKLPSTSKFKLGASGANAIFDCSVLNGNTNIGYIAGNDAHVRDVTLSDNTVTRVQMFFTTSYSATITIYPMIRLATDINPTYRPYAMSNAELTQRLLALEARLSSNISSIELET